MKIETQQLEAMTLRGVRAAYNLCSRDGVSFEDHFAHCEGNANLILHASEEACQMVRRSTSRIYTDMNEGRFPRPIRIGVHALAWLESDLQGWLASRIGDRDQREAA